VQGFLRTAGKSVVYAALNKLSRAKALLKNIYLKKAKQILGRA